MTTKRKVPVIVSCGQTFARERLQECWQFRFGQFGCALCFIVGTKAQIATLPSPLSNFCTQAPHFATVSIVKLQADYYQENDLVPTACEHLLELRCLDRAINLYLLVLLSDEGSLSNSVMRLTLLFFWRDRQVCLQDQEASVLQHHNLLLLLPGSRR